MKMAPIEFDSDVFSCVRKDEFAILSFKEDALKISTTIGAKEELFSVLSAIEESTSVKGLMVINSEQYPGEAERLRLFEEIIRCESNEGKKHIIAKINAMHSQIMHTMVNFDKPIVIGMHGKIESFFIGISFAAEYRIATPDTVLVRINAKLGLPPDGVFAFFLIRNLGQIKAIDLLLSKSAINASEAYDLGLLTEIVNENELQNRCLEKLKRICELPSYLISATRRLVQPELNDLNNFINRSYQDYYMNLMVMQQKSE